MSRKKRIQRWGYVFWITGLSGSGKTTLGARLYEWLKERRRNVVFLDGDVVRELLLEPGGYDRESRLRIARFNGRLCRFLASQGMDVVCPTISLFHECQAWNREHIPTYVEIFLDAPMEVLLSRDPKGIYRRALDGEIKNVVGIDIPAETPRNPDIVLRCTREMTPEQMLSWVTEHFKKTMPQ